MLKPHDCSDTRLKCVRAQAKTTIGMMHIYSWIDLIVFLAGVITIMSGHAPAFRFPFFRR